jgi:ABC-type lipoprotein release transport system permease subunit
MEKRIFGKELTNIIEADFSKKKPSQSFLVGEPLKESLSLKQGEPIFTKPNMHNNPTFP